MVVFHSGQLVRGVWRRRALTPLNRQMEPKNGLWAGRLQNFAARARSEDERPAYLGKRASRLFLALGSTSETLVVRDNRDGCLPIETPSLPTLARSYPRHFYVDHSHCLVLAPATLAALPSIRAIPDRDVFYVALPTRSILVTRHTPLVAYLNWTLGVGR